MSVDNLSEGKFGSDGCGRVGLRALLKRLKVLSSSTWTQVDSAHQHGLGYEKIPLDEIAADTGMFPKEKVAVFRFSGKKPMLFT